MFGRFSIWAALFFYLILFFSCKKENACDCFKGRGAPISETRIITSAFNTLQTFDKVDVYYIQDTTANNCIVKVVTGKNLASNVTTEVVNGVLQIKDNNKCNFVRSDNSVTVYVTAPHITHLIQDGVGNMYSGNTIIEDTISYNVNNSGDIHLNLNVKWVYGRLYGVGDVYLNGNAKYHLTNGVGECFVNAQNLLVSNYCFIDYKSTGEARLNITGELDAVVRYTGNIYYYGNPTVVKKSGDGSGQLIKK